MSFFKSNGFGKSTGGCSGFNLSDGNDSSDNSNANSRFGNSMGTSRRSRSETRQPTHHLSMSSSRMGRYQDDKVRLEYNNHKVWGPQSSWKTPNEMAPSEFTYSSEPLVHFDLTNEHIVEWPLNSLFSPIEDSGNHGEVFDAIHPLHPEHYRDFLKAREIVGRLLDQSRQQLRDGQLRRRLLSEGFTGPGFGDS